MNRLREPLRSSGQFAMQPEGFRAFIPQNLPPDPQIQIDGTMQQLLSRADRSLCRLDGSAEVLPNVDLFVFMYVRKEAVLSSQIEGTQASLDDVLAAEANIYDPNRPDDTEEILNYIAALNHGLTRLPELPLSLRLIRELHLRLMQGVCGQKAEPGEFRSRQNWIGPKGANLQNATFVPPPPAELPELLAAFERYLHEDDDLPPLIRLALIHAQFETIHPFLDGNGRIGRLLITFWLCERALLQKPVLYLSHYLKRHRATYYDLLTSIRTEGRWEDWINFFLQGVAEVADEAAQTARKFISMREEHRQLLVNMRRGSPGALALLESLYQKPVVTVATVAARIGVSGQSANLLTERFVELGLLKEITGQKRNRVFRYEPYLDLFTD